MAIFPKPKLPISQPAAAQPMQAGPPMDADADDNAPGKIAQEDAGYESPSQSDDTCGECTYFAGPSDCKLVLSPIDAGGWCKLYQGGGGAGTDNGSQAGALPAGGMPSQQ